MSTPNTKGETLKEQIKAAFVYAYPLFAFAETRFRAVQDYGNPDRHDPNTICHNRTLSDHESHWITSPNNDTLYSNAWLDLSAGPVRVTVDAMPDGYYWSLAFMDAFTNHFAVVGQRLEGRGPVDFTVAGPDHDTDSIHGRVIRAPGNDAWMFCRCLVDGPESLLQTHARQDSIRVAPNGEPSGKRFVAPELPITAENFLDVANEYLARNPVPGAEADMVSQWAAIGLRPGGPGAWSEMDAEVRAAWAETIGENYGTLAAAGQKGRRNFGGWIAAASDIGNFGTNYDLRASVALGGLGALEPVEAMYFVKYEDEGGKPLSGGLNYTLRVPPEGIPARSFWSFTMYGYTPEGKRVLVKNPMQRYSVGNRTPGLVYADDGALNIALRHEEPTQANVRSNWLPTPEGAFHIALRTYLPTSALRNGKVPLPTILRDP